MQRLSRSEASFLRDKPAAAPHSSADSAAVHCPYACSTRQQFAGLCLASQQRQAAVPAQVCKRVAETLQAGIVWINCSQPAFVQAPSFVVLGSYGQLSSACTSRCSMVLPQICMCLPTQGWVSQLCLAPRQGSAAHCTEAADCRLPGEA